MKRKTLMGAVTFGIVVVALLLISNYEIIIGKRIIPNGMRLFLWYGLVLYTCYQSAWGYFSESSYASTKSIKLLGYVREIPRETHNRLWKTSAVILFVISTTGFFIGLTQLAIK
ncbi:MAG: hypothetical protein JW800_03115 [Candidatus Omnitrophica bacterium]|nr:hypothetical protein [Candidatus Omnitrophota bacterium]